MIFNSLIFLVFLPIVFGLYWFVCGRDVYGQSSLLAVVGYGIPPCVPEGRPPKEGFIKTFYMFYTAKEGWPSRTYRSEELKR